MMHTRIEQEEIVERYARKQLTPEEQQAFEEHFFSCEECFQKLQEMERFLAGVRDAGERGFLKDKTYAVAAGRSRWFLPALAAATCAALLGLTSGWMYLHEIPQLRGELEQTTKQLYVARQRAELEHKGTVPETAEANVPLVMLQTSRSGVAPTTVVLPREARHLVLWIEIGPSRYRDFRLEVFSPQGQPVTSLDHLKPGPYGALAASLPTEQLPRGECRIKLTGQDPAPATLAGEYLLRINKP
jgi:hypothetical protein